MRTKTGLEVLLTQQLSLLKGRRVGLVTHAAAVLPDLTTNVDALRQAGVDLRVLFAPEHGLSGAVADGMAVADSVDPCSGLPVYSLFGATFEPTLDMVADVDVLLFDMQDVGVRFYTYLSTLYYVLLGAARLSRPVVVLDRPNPIGGLILEGPLVQPTYRSFLGVAPLPIRHGMTLGELARYFCGELQIAVDLTVVPMEGWRRDRWFDGTGLPWVPTSPAMPHLSTATVYPGLCLVEGTNLSEGRGTALPFALCGAPWLDACRLAAELNRRELPGVRFRPVFFEPSASKHAGQLCQGVQVHVVDRLRLRAVEVGLEVVAACRRQAPERFAFLPSPSPDEPAHFDYLAGTPAVREAILSNRPVKALTAEWQADLAAFAEVRRPYLLYP